MLSFSKCSDDQFTCADGQCVDMKHRCDGRTHCDDGSDEYGCKLIVPNIGYKKYLVPLPLESEPVLYLTASYIIESIIFINEDENFLRHLFGTNYEWFNSYLTFQHLKNGSQNFLSPMEKDEIWLPWVVIKNMESEKKCQSTEVPETIEIVPNSNFNYVHNSKIQHQNAFLFKVLEINRNTVKKNWPFP